jgi:menaquinone-9 beta-reductase
MNVQNSTITIIGAGPAGQITSLFLAKRGISCLLVDKVAHPRSKACADVVTGQAIRILNELDAELPLDKVFQDQYLPINGTLLHAPNGKILDIPFLPLHKLEHLPTCIAMPRKAFDAWLHQKIIASPLIQLRENTSITDCKRAETGEWTLFNAKKEPIIQTKLLIIATGSSASLPFSVGKLEKEDKHFAIGIRGYFRNVGNESFPNHAELFFHQKLMPGGFYIAPFRDGVANVNIVMRSDVVKRNQLNLNHLFWEVMDLHPTLRERFKHAEQVGKLEGGALHLGTKKRHISGDGYMIVGDAGGLIDLISANGIPQAMISGKFAAEQAIIALEKQNFSAAVLKDYDVKVFKKIDNELKLGRIASPFLGYPFVLKGILHAINFLSSRQGAQKQLQKLLYTTNMTATLLNPMFYWRLLLGKHS